MGFSLVLHGTVPKDEIMGVLVGHVWYFFDDVYPPLHNGSRPLHPPNWWCRLFDGVPEAGNAVEDTNDDIGVRAPEVGLR
jgi:Derlin-2/3